MRSVEYIFTFRVKIGRRVIMRSVIKGVGRRKVDALDMAKSRLSRILDGQGVKIFLDRGMRCSSQSFS
jgi:hypothetical protein